MRRGVLLIALLVVATSAVLVGARDSSGWGATGAAEFGVVSGVVLADNGGWVVAANADGSGVRTLTAPLSGLGDSDPVASPDGSLIAFVRDLERVKVMRPDGSGLRDLGEGSTTPAWAPDGSFLAYGSDPFGITVVRPDGSDRRLLVSDNAWFGFTWSPDGTSIAYASSDGISVVNVHTRVRWLLFKLEHAWRPAWSPDGSQIAFLGSLGKGKDFVERVLVMNADGSGVHPVGPKPNAETPAWSPDGTRLSFGESTSGEPGGVVVVDVSTGLVTARIPPFGGGPSAVPSWSPDGERIAFLRSSEAKTYADYDGDVWVARADGSTPVQVTRLFPLGGSSSVPRWLPAVAAITPDPPIATAALPAATWQQLGRRYLIAAVDRTAVALVPDPNGPSASVSANKLGIWDHRGAVSWVATGKLPAHNAALAGRRVYWSYWGTDRYRLTLSGLWTATWPHGRIVRLRYLSGEREGPGITVEGDRSLVVHTLGHSLWRLRGTTARRIRHEDTELTPLSVNAGRALIANGRRRLEVIDPSGRLLASLPKPQGYVWARLSGNRLLVLTDSKIRVYQLPGGRLRSTRPIGAIGRARQAGFPYGSLFPYQTKEHMHLLDVDTGQDRIFTVHDELSPTSVGITSAGLFYTAAHPYAGINGEAGQVPLTSLRTAVKQRSLAERGFVAKWDRSRGGAIPLVSSATECGSSLTSRIRHPRGTVYRRSIESRMRARLSRDSRAPASLQGLQKHEWLLTPLLALARQAQGLPLVLSDVARASRMASSG